MNKLTTFTSYGRSAGSARVRVFDWLDYTQISAESHTYLNTSNNSLKTLLSHPGATLSAEAKLRQAVQASPEQVLISRQASPLSSGALEEKLLRRAQLGVYDFDDALYLDQHGKLGALFSKGRIWERSVRAADLVIAGNEILAEQAQALNEQTVIIPSCVQPDFYLQKHNYELSEVPRAIWIGSPSTEHYLNSISAALVLLHSATGMRLTVLSSGERSLGELDVMVDRVTWTPQNYLETLAQADVGIMPLEDSAWARGKCAYKLLQYGAAGLPVVGSPVGVNRTVLAQADGFAPTTTDEWVDALSQLISESTATRQARGTAARAAVVEGYSFAAWESRWREATGQASGTQGG